MAKHKAPIVAELVDPKTWVKTEVMKAENIYAVVYDGQLINIRSQNVLENTDAKYKKVSYSNPGFAHVMADRLNKQFKTDKFEVYEMGSGTKHVATKER